MNPKHAHFVKIYARTDDLQISSAGSGVPIDDCKKLLENNKVRNLIHEKRKAIGEEYLIEPADILAKWMEIVRVDPRELAQLHIVCCRYCHGIDHAYQWDITEWSYAANNAMLQGKPAPEALGGFGFNPTLDPDSECPQCGGLGETHAVYTDTRKLSPDALKLFAGVRQTKYGPEIAMHDQSKALENIAKYLGMFITKTELTGKNGEPLKLSSTVELTDEQLAAIAAAGLPKNADPS